MEFNTENVDFPMDEPLSGDRMKNIKELKFANSSFTVDATGKTEWRDRLGNVVGQFDPNAD